MVKSALLITALSSMALACNGQSTATHKKTGNEPMIVKKHTPEDVGNRYYAANAAVDKRVEELYAAMTPQQRAAQMIMVASSETLGYPYATTVKTSVQAQNAANVLFLKGTRDQFIKQHDELVGYKIEGLVPLFACDCEPTLLHNKFPGQPKMNATANLKTEDAVRASVDTINHLMDEIGISINFAPIVDIGKNAAIINKRSFGNDPAVIIKQAGVFIDETQKDGKAATIKHFPGHGAVTGDTHKQSVYINGKMTELATFEKVMNQSKPVFVMVGHISVRNNPEGFNTENDRPATTSRKIVTELLREKMGFKGIITTDAMNMQASKNFPDADWEAAKAGVDLVLMPADPAKLNRLIAAEIAKGSAMGKQFEASVKRVIKLKLLQ
ncbi:Beta-hexosaminidase A precursor [compost metagenome]